MKKTLITILVTVLVLSSQVLAQESGFGAGIIIGELTGLSGKLWLTKETALDGAVAWSFGGQDNFYLHSDYLFHRFNLIAQEQINLPVHFGLGGRVRLGKKDRLGFRGVVGLSYYVQKLPMDIFIEVAPIFDLLPSTDFDLNAGIGVRYFFTSR